MLYVIVGIIFAITSIVLGIENWTPEEKTLLLGLQRSTTIPKDQTNAVADNPKAAKLGHQLFFDKRFSESGEIACASCHVPDTYFSDAKQVSEGIGMTNRNAPTIVGATWNKWQFWDGRSDSLWSQALGPIENPSEHGFSRAAVAQIIFTHYKNEYETIFGSMPPLDDYFRFPDNASPLGDEDAKANWQHMTTSDQILVNRIFANVGKSIAAYERLIKPGESRADQYIQALRENRSTDKILKENEQAGMRLFIGKAKCVTCHSGSQLSDQQFHNTGVPMVADLPLDVGRSTVNPQVSSLEFGCAGIYSDNQKVCQTQPVNQGIQAMRAYKTPSLRNVAQTAPYMHAGQFKTLRAVLEHYNEAPKAPMGITEITGLGLNKNELNQLEAFLESLSAAPDSPDALLRNPAQ